MYCKGVIGVINHEKKKIILAVYRINTEEKELKLDLEKWVNNSAKVTLEYPVFSETEYFFEQYKLNVIMKNNNTARLFVIDL